MKKMSKEFSLGWRRGGGRVERERENDEKTSPCKFPSKFVSRRCSVSDEDAI